MNKSEQIQNHYKELLKLYGDSPQAVQWTE